MNGSSDISQPSVRCLHITQQFYHLVSNNGYSIQEVRYKSDGSRQEIIRTGIQVNFAQSGSIGQFHFITLLTNLVAAFALLSVSSSIVELLMCYVLPKRKQYMTLKYQTTEQFNGTVVPISEKKAENVTDAAYKAV